MDQRVGFGFVKGGISDIILIDTKIMMKDGPDLPLFFAGIAYIDPPQKDIVVACDRVGARDLQPEISVCELYVRDEGFRKICETPLPSIIADPGKFAVRPNAKAGRIAFGMVLLSYMWEINIADPVSVVEIYKQTAVTDRNIAHIEGRSINDTSAIKSVRICTI